MQIIFNVDISNFAKQGKIGMTYESITDWISGLQDTYLYLKTLSKLMLTTHPPTLNLTNYFLTSFDYVEHPPYQLKFQQRQIDYRIVYRIDYKWFI